MGEKATTTRPLAKWEFVPDTTEIPDEDYAELETLDISDFDVSDEEPSAAARAIAMRALHAFQSMGFLVITGHGLSGADIHRQFDLAKMLLDDVSEDEKHALHARIAQEGSWAGYKPLGYHKRPDGTKDSQEHYDFYPYTAYESRLPRIARPYLPEFRRFIEYNHYVLLRKVLRIISLGLDLPLDTLWKLHQRGGLDNDGALQGPLDEPPAWEHTKDHLRYVMYHPPSEEDREKKRHIWLPGHTDLGSVTFNYSQPIAGLQVYLPDGHWRYIRHYPGAIVASLGDCMEFLSGGILKAAPHRVSEPPPDQRHLRRASVIFFAPFLPEVPLAPLPGLVDRVTHDAFAEYRALGGAPLTSNEWLVRRSKLVGKQRTKRAERVADDVLEDIAFRYT